MSSALAIPGVTAVLRHYLNNVYNNVSSVLGSVTVAAKAPDIIQAEVGTGQTRTLLVNLFLHQVTPNAAWRNIGLPSLAADGGTVLKNPPLALDLHYLLTAYAFEDSHAEALLGYAVSFLHDNPVLARAQITTALTALPANAFCDGLRLSGLASQIEMIKITPATLGREEMAWIWTALKADYRPTFPFQVSVVLINPTNAAVAALPVLTRKVAAQPNLLSTFATLTEADPPGGQPAANLGDIVTVEGANLAGAASVLLINSRQVIRQTIGALSNVQDSSFQFTIPNPSLPPPQLHPSDLPAGIYTLTAQVTSGADTLDTNAVPFAIAPQIGSSWAPGTLPSGTTTVTVPCAPYVRPGQQVSLLIGGQEASADPFTTPTNSPSFTFPALQPTPLVPVRLRVDGIDSPILDLTKTPPVFTGPMVQVT
ncbi:MAG TPA: Pvc16 family protein [Candidatus Binatia bacterium]|nr:Pvc16 family protein [Candidatus Binatia bacterium]